MQENKPTLKTILKMGTFEVEIFCTEDQLQNAVADLINVFVSKEQELSQISIVHHIRQTNTCMNSLKILLSEGWFSSKKYFSDVQLELLRRGLHYHRSAVSHCLEDLYREGLLAREGIPRRYTFINSDKIIR